MIRLILGRPSAVLQGNSRVPIISGVPAGLHTALVTSVCSLVTLDRRVCSGEREKRHFIVSIVFYRCCVYTGTFITRSSNVLYKYADKYLSAKPDDARRFSQNSVESKFMLYTFFRHFQFLGAESMYQTMKLPRPVGSLIAAAI